MKNDSIVLLISCLIFLATSQPIAHVHFYVTKAADASNPDLNSCQEAAYITSTNQTTVEWIKADHLAELQVFQDINAPDYVQPVNVPESGWMAAGVYVDIVVPGEQAWAFVPMVFCDANCNVDFLGSATCAMSAEGGMSTASAALYSFRQKGSYSCGDGNDRFSVARDAASTTCNLVNDHLNNKGNLLRLIAYCDLCIPADPSIPWAPPIIPEPEVHYDFTFTFELVTSDVVQTELPEEVYDRAVRRLYQLFQSYGLNYYDYEVKIEFVYVPYSKRQDAAGAFTGNVSIGCVNCDADEIDELVTGPSMDAFIDDFANSTGTVMGGRVTILTRPSDPPAEQTEDVPQTEDGLQTEDNLQTEDGSEDAGHLMNILFMLSIIVTIFFN